MKLKPTESQIAELESKGFEIERDDAGVVISITERIDPGPLVVSDKEYVKELFEVRNIFQVMHAVYDDDGTKLVFVPKAVIRDNLTFASDDMASMFGNTLV